MDEGTPRPRVLLIAEAANPEWVSVPLVGWSHARALAQVTDAHLVTQVRNRDAIVRAGLTEGREFTAIDSEAVAERAHRFATRLRGASGVGWTTVTAVNAIAYPYFEHLVWQQFGARIRSREFDIVHRITPLSPTTSSSLAKKCAQAGVPFVLGPLNGGVPWPKGFDTERRREREWLSYVRDGYKLLPGYRATRQHAAAILIASRDTWQQMPAAYRDKCFYVPENAIEPARFSRRRAHAASLPLRGVFIGRLVPYKGADMMLQAAAPLLKAGRLTIEIIGDGPQLPDLRALAEREGVAHAVTFSGWVEHAQIQDRLAEKDVLIFPSIREFGGGVALEAMAIGVVPVVPNYGGLGELVSDDTGFRIAMGSREQIVERFRDVLTRLADDPRAIDEKSAAAYKRAHEHFTWSAKAQQSLAVYQWLLGRAPRPDLPLIAAR